MKILDDGYEWLFICRDGARHVVTAHCDERGRPVHWYIDVVERWAVGAEGFPVYEDLFLDVVATPSGGAELRDVDELEEALIRGGVTPEQYAAAHGEAVRVLAAVQSERYVRVGIADGGVPDAGETRRPAERVTRELPPMRRPEAPRVHTEFLG